MVGWIYFGMMPVLVFGAMVLHYAGINIGLDEHEAGLAYLIIIAFWPIFAVIVLITLVVAAILYLLSIPAKSLGTMIKSKYQHAEERNEDH